MDLKSLTRKELQALCKKHGIPANSTSVQLIESLSSIFENHDKVKPKACLKGSGGGGADDLGDIGGNLRKKVSFVVEDKEDDKVEGIARNPVGNSKGQSVANEVVGIKRRSTRSSGLADVLRSPVTEKTAKKSMGVGTEGVRRNDKPILSEVSTTRSLRNRVVVAGRDEDSSTDQNSRRSQKRNSIAGKKVTFVIEDEEDDVSEEITRDPVGNSKRKSDVNDVVEIEKRSTRSRGLAEAVLWSPGIEKTKKKSLRDGSEGVRRNDKPISSEVPAIRSLRNRIVVVGGEEELADDHNLIKNQKRKISDKKEENEMVASKLEGDEFVGRKNLRKRSRGGDFVGDEAPDRRFSGNHAKSEENVANLEEVDVGRSMKRRKRDTDGLITGEGLNENIERTNGRKGMVVNSNAVESIDVNNAEGQKKVQSRGKTRASKRGGRTTFTLDGKVVILPARRSTRSFSLVGKSDEEVEAVKEGKLQKHVKDGADGEFVSEPERSSTQSSSALREHGTSLSVTRLPVEAAKGHGSEGVEVIGESSWTSTLSSSVVGKSDEEGRPSKKGRSQKGGLPDSAVVAEPIRRSTRASSTLQEDGVAKSVSAGEVVKKSKSQKQAKGHGSKGGGSTTSLQDSESIAEPVRRSTRSSSSLLENETSLPVVEAVKRVKRQKQGKDRVLKGQAAPLSDNEASPIRESTHSSLKLSEDEAQLAEIGILSGDEEAIKNKNPGKQRGIRVSKLGDPTAFLPENETLTELEMRSTRDSPKLLDGVAFSPIVEGNTATGTGDHASKMDDHATAISTRRSTRGSSKLLKDGPVVSESVRRATRGSLKHISLEVESSPVERKKTRKGQREDDLGGQRSAIRAQTKSLAEHEQSKELLTKSVRSTSKKNVLGGDKVEDSKSDEAISVSDPPIAGISLDLSIDVGSGDVETESNDAVDKNVHEIRQSLSSALPVNFEGSSEIEVNITNLFPTEPSSTIEVNSEPAAPSKISKELSATFETEISLTAHPKEPDSMVIVGSERDNIITGCEMMHVSSSPVPKSSEELSLRTVSHTSLAIDLEEPRLEAEIYGEETDIVVPTPVCKSSEELILTDVTKADPEIYLKEPDSKVEDDGPCEDVVADDGALNIFDPLTSDIEVCSDSHTSHVTCLEEPRLKLEICGADEDSLQDNEVKDILIQTSACESSELTQTSVTVANPEVDFKEPDSKVEVDPPREDVIGDNEAKTIFDPLTSDTGDGPCEDVVADDGALNIFDPLTSDIEVCSDSHTSHVTCLEEPRLKLEICGADEDSLQGNEVKDILIQTSACESSELTQTSVTVANPEVDFKEPDSKVEVDPPREDVIGDNETKTIFDPLTSDTGVCSETLCDINVVGSDSKVEVHDATKGDMEQNESTTAVSSVMSCKSTGILSSTSLNEAYPHSDIGQVDVHAMNKEASHSEGFLTEASDIHLDGNPGDTSSPQTIFDNEMENYKANPDIILKSHLDDRELDIINNIEAVTCEYGSLKHISLEVESSPVESEKTTTAHPKEPDSMDTVGIEHDNILTGCEMMHVSSSPVPKSSEELSLRTDSHTSPVIDLQEPRLEAGIHGASEDGFGCNEETDIVVPAPVCKSSEELTLTAVTKADPGIYLNEPVSKVEDDGPCEDVVADDGPCEDEAEIHGASEDGFGCDEEADIVVPTPVCKSSEELTLTAVTKADPGIYLNEPVSKVEDDGPCEDVVADDGPCEDEAEIYGASEDGGCDEETDIVVPTPVCKSSEEPTLTAVTKADPGIYLNEPVSKVEDDGPCEDVVADDGPCEDEAEIHGASEDGFGCDEETDIVVPTPVCKSSEELTPTAVTKADPGIYLREPVLKMEDDGPCEDIVADDGPCEDVVADDGSLNVFDPLTSDTAVYSDSHNSHGTCLEEPRLKLEICGADEDGLQDDEEKDILIQTSAGESSEELTHTSVSVANPDVDLKEPDSKVEVDRPREDVIGDNEAKKFFDPLTSDTGVCSETLCDINFVGSDSKVEVHDAIKADMEQNEATTAISSIMSCKPTGILSPTSLNEASPHSDLGQVGLPAMNKEASHSEGFLTEASDIHCKTLEVSMTVDGNPGYTSSPQTIFDNEMENCKANPDIILKSHLEDRECDIINNIEAVTCDKHPQLSEEDLDVMKETRVSSTVSVTVSDGTEIGDERIDAEKNENELRSSLPMESRAVEGIQSLSEELADAEQSDFTHSLYEKESGDAEKKSRVSDDEDFSAESNDSLMPPAVFMKSEGTSYAAPLEHKDEPSAFEYAEVSTEITEDKYSVEHGESEKQMENDYELCDADVESEGCSASSNENTSLTDAVLFEDVKKLVDHGDLPGQPVIFTCGEEMPLCGTESPTLSGKEGLTMQVDIQGFSSIRDIEDERNLSDHQEVTANVSENLGIDIVDGSKSAAKKHVDVEQLNSNSGPLPETCIIVNKLTDAEFESTTELGGIVLEEMDNIGSLERDVNGEGCDGSKADTMEPDKVDLSDYVGPKRDNASIFQEINRFSGELHADENTSHTSLNDSACESAEGWVLRAEKFSPSICIKNDLSLDCREEQLDGDSGEKTTAEDGAPYGEEFLSTSNFSPLSDQQECQDNNLEEHAVDNDIEMSVSGMDQYFGDLDEHSNKFQGTYDDSFFTDMFEEFEQASIADEACVADCEAQTEKSFHMNTEAENFSSASAKNFEGLATQEQNKQNPHDQTEDGGQCAQNPSYYRGV